MTGASLLKREGGEEERKEKLRQSHDLKAMKMWNGRLECGMWNENKE